MEQVWHGRHGQGGFLQALGRILSGRWKLYRHRESLVGMRLYEWFCTDIVSSQDETSEQWIGEWMEARRNRNQIVLATKVSDRDSNLLLYYLTYVDILILALVHIEL